MAKTTMVDRNGVALSTRKYNIDISINATVEVEAATIEEAEKFATLDNDYRLVQVMPDARKKLMEILSVSIYEGEDL